MNFKVLIPSFFLSVATTCAAQAQTDIKPNTAEPKKSLPYQAFPMKHPKTGKPMKPEDMVTLGDGRKMKAKKYFKNLNDMEKYLSGRGYTLRDQKENLGVVAELKSTERLKERQLKAIKEQMQDSSGLFAAPQQASLLSPTIGGRTITPTFIPGTLVPKLPECSPLASGVNATRSFTSSMGNRSSAQLSLSAVGVFAADCKRVSGGAVGSAIASLFNNDIPIFRGEANGDVDKQGAAHLNFTAMLGGKQVFDLRESKAGGLVLSRSFRQEMVASVTARAVIVFIPVSFTAGAKGQASIDFSANAVGLSANGSVVPAMRVSAFAEGAVDVFFARAGAGASLLLLDISLPTEFRAKVGSTETSRFAEGSLTANSRLRALDGRFFLFAELNLLFVRPRMELDLIKFSGFDVNGNLLSLTNARDLTIKPIVAGSGTGINPVIIRERL